MILGKMQVQKVPAFSVAGLKNGLVSCWEMDETSGTIAYDSHGSNHGSIGNQTVINQAGKCGQCFNFGEDVDACVDAGDCIVTSGNFTISCWVNMNSVAATKDGRHVFFSKGIAWDNAFNDTLEWALTYYAEAGKFRFDVGKQSIVDNIYSSADGYSASTWYHILGEWNNSTDVQSIYVNGVLKGSKTHRGTASEGVLNLTAPVRIGRSGIILNEGKFYANAKIDQVCYWSRLLSSVEKTQIINSGNGLPYSNW